MEDSPEEWRQAYGRWVSDTGRVWGKKSGEPFDPLPGEDGYKRVSIASRKEVCLQVLVCTAFHGPAPSPKHQADHINNDRGDNRASNLRWVTPSENNANRRKPRPYQNARPIEVNFGEGWINCSSINEAVRTFGFNTCGIMKVLKGEQTHHNGALARYVEPDTPEGEEWKTVDGCEVSNRNRYRNARGTVFTARSNTATGYCRCLGHQFHILVCTAWHGPKPFPKAVVDHKNRNRSDNRPENLHWTTQKENMANSSHKTQNRVHNKKRVRMTDPDGNSQDFESYVDAAKRTGVGKAAIRHVVARNGGSGFTGGLHWMSVQ